MWVPWILSKISAHSRYSLNVYLRNKWCKLTQPNVLNLLWPFPRQTPFPESSSLLLFSPTFYMKGLKNKHGFRSFLDQYLAQEFTNYGPMIQILPIACFVNKILLGQIKPLCFHLVAFALQWPTWVVVIETVWPMSLKYLWTSPLQKNFTDPCSCLRALNKSLNFLEPQFLICKSAYNAGFIRWLWNFMYSRCLVNVCFVSLFPSFINRILVPLPEHQQNPCF